MSRGAILHSRGAHPSPSKNFPRRGRRKTKRSRACARERTGRRRSWNTGIAAPYADYRPRCAGCWPPLNIEFRSRYPRLDESRTSGPGSCVRDYGDTACHREGASTLAGCVRRKRELDPIGRGDRDIGHTSLTYDSYWILGTTACAPILQKTSNFCLSCSVVTDVSRSPLSATPEGSDVSYFYLYRKTLNFPRAVIFSGTHSRLKWIRPARATLLKFNIL